MCRLMKTSTLSSRDDTNALTTTIQTTPRITTTAGISNQVIFTRKSSCFPNSHDAAALRRGYRSHPKFRWREPGAKTRIFRRDVRKITVAPMRRYPCSPALGEAQRRMMPAVGHIDDEPDHQPYDKPHPGDERQSRHQQQAKQDPEDRHDRYGRHPERA